MYFAVRKLHEMQARYYDPVVGRFLSIDPVTFMDTGEPDFFNRYAYTANDPINNIDPDGKAKLKFFVETVKGVRRRVGTRKQAQNSRNNQKSVDVLGPGSSKKAKQIERTTNPGNVTRDDGDPSKFHSRDHYQPAKRGKRKNQLKGHTNYGSSSSSNDAGTFESALSISDTYGSNVVTEALDFANPAADVGYAVDSAIGAATDLNEASGFSEAVSDTISSIGTSASNAIEATREYLEKPF